MKNLLLKALWVLLNYPSVAILTLVTVIASAIHLVCYNDQNEALWTQALGGAVCITWILLGIFQSIESGDLYWKGTQTIMFLLTILVALISLGCYLSGNKHMIFSQLVIYMSPILYMFTCVTAAIYAAVYCALKLLKRWVNEKTETL
ncbi:MAG: hypothetical protein E7018_00615 [Alphaproteobacteria bacterium]|nr:hypothetical protein [Alphaproteobacteria bacterium]